MNIIAFTYDNSNIRTTITENGEPLFCGKDAAAALGYNDLKDALARHCRGRSRNTTPSSTASDANRKHASSPKATSTA